MIDKPITYLSVSPGPNAGDNDAWIGVRVVPVGRDGKSIFARTLNEGEPDSGEGIIVQPGDERIVFPPGNLTITIKDIDRESRPGPDGYAGRVEYGMDMAHDKRLDRGGSLSERRTLSMPLCLRASVGYSSQPLPKFAGRVRGAAGRAIYQD